MSIRRKFARNQRFNMTQMPSTSQIDLQIDSIKRVNYINKKAFLQESTRKGVTEEFKEANSCLLKGSVLSQKAKDTLDVTAISHGRRIEAVIKTMPEAKDHLSDMYLQSDVDFALMAPTFERDWARSNAMVISGYHKESEFDAIILGAALWILDTIKSNGKMDELDALLPNDERVTDQIILPFLWDSTHSLSMIKRLIYVLLIWIRGRDNTKLDTTYVKNDELAKKIPHLLNKENKQLLKNIFGLISQQDKDIAVHTFEQKGWELVKTYYRAKYAICKAQSNIVEQAKEVENQLNEHLAKTESKDLRSNNMIRLYTQKANQLSADYDKICRKEALLYLYYYVQPFASHGVKTKHLGDEIADILDDFAIENPYLLCFGLMYSLYMDSDLSWTYCIGVALMSQVVRRLPWYYLAYNIGLMESKDDIIKTFSSIFHNVSDMCNSQPYQDFSEDDLLDFYNPVYTDSQKDEMDRTVSNLAQVIFTITCCCPPRNYNLTGSVHRMKRFGVDNKTIAKVMSAVAIGCNAVVQTKQENDKALFMKKQVTDYLDENEKLNMVIPLR